MEYHLVLHSAKQEREKVRLTIGKRATNNYGPAEHFEDSPTTTSLIAGLLCSVGVKLWLAMLNDFHLHCAWSLEHAPVSGRRAVWRFACFSYLLLSFNVDECFVFQMLSY